VCGRAKDVVILRGANHTPQEFEECLDGLDGVRAGCAVALGFQPEGADGEELLVLAERATPAVKTDAEVVLEIRRAILERTSLKPHTVELLAPGTLPRTSSGKLRRGEALRRWLEGELTAPDAVSPLRMAGAIARSALGHVRAGLTRK
jgi:acyl-CoA synthetase (AMP-forming)/AMP-acid ligase II